MLAPRKKLWSTPLDVTLVAIQLLNPFPDDIVYDIGAGEGNFIIECAKQRNCTTIGVEIDPERSAYAELRIAECGLNSAVCRVICGNALEIDFSNATCFFLYLVPRGLRLILPILQNCPNRIRVVTYMSPLPAEISPIHVVKVGTQQHPEAQWPLYFYEFGSTINTIETIIP